MKMGLDVKYGKMGINMKGSGKKENDMVSALKHGKMEIFIKGIIRRIKNVALEYTFHQMEASSKVYGRRGRREG